MLEGSIRVDTKRIVLFFAMPGLPAVAEDITRDQLGVSAAKLGHKAQDKYSPLFLILEKEFGEAKVFTSTYPSAVLLVGHLFNPCPEIPEFSELLNPSLTYQNFQGGAWLNRQKCHPVDKLARNLCGHLLDDKDPRAAEDRKKMRQFLASGEDRFRFAITYEPFISIGLEEFLPPAEVGLRQCDGALVQLSDSNEILRVDLVPFDTKNRDFKKVAVMKKRAS